MASIEYGQVSPLFVKGDTANRCMLGNERERDGVTGIDLVKQMILIAAGVVADELQQHK